MNWGEVVTTLTMVGTALAVAISFSNNKSITWGIIHGLLGWFYIIYFILIVAPHLPKENKWL